jgi:dihydroorotate dehydrogenase electron transfer subunit
MTIDYWRLTLASREIAAAAKPGQFVMLTIAPPEDPMPVLPRPMAIYGWNRTEGTFDIVYRIVGDGTRRISTWRPGASIVAVGPLGRGFTLPERRGPVLILGRGIGICSLTALAGEATASGFPVHAVASARNRGALAGDVAFRTAGVVEIVEVLDDDGSSAPERLRERLRPLCDEGLAAIYVCGSNRLLALGVDLAAVNGAIVQVSIEAHMACGLGFCHGCAAGRPGLPRETPLVCSDGPVFRYVAPGAEGR